MPEYLQFQKLNLDTRKCEAEGCGQEFIAGYGYSLALCWLVTGHSHIGSFMCDEEIGHQHWGCTIEHAVEATLYCLHNHMIKKLNDKYLECDEQGKTRVSPDEAHIFDNNNPTFHHVNDYTEFYISTKRKHEEHIKKLKEKDNGKFVDKV